MTQPTPCPRCGRPMRSYPVSYFNMQEICSTCKTEERQLPGFAAAEQAETAARFWRACSGPTSPNGPRRTTSASCCSISDR